MILDQIKFNTDKLNLEREKFIKDFNLKLKQQREEERKNKVAEAQRQEEIGIKRKATNKKPSSSK